MRRILKNGKSIIYLLVGLPLGALAEGSVKSGVDQVPVASATYVAPAPGTGLKVELGPKGLASLKYNGEELLLGPNYGAVELFNHPKMFKPDGTAYDAVSQPSLVTRQDNTITQVFPWGRLITTYGLESARLNLNVVVENTSTDELRTSLRLAALKFPVTPNAAVVDVGMWGNGGNAKLGAYPMGASASSFPPVMAIQSAVAQLHFCLDPNDPPTPADTRSGFARFIQNLMGRKPAKPVMPEWGGSVGVPFCLDGGAYRTFPFACEVGNIPAGGKREATFSLRFAPAGTGPITFAGARDVLESFARRHPMELKWQDHRPIGMAFLATSGVTGEALKTNPNRWMVANGTTNKVDTTTPEGRQEFQKLVLRWADGCIKTIKDAGGQGMVTWDPEGQRIGDTFYGEPHMIGKLAPEMEEEVEVTVMEKGRPKTLKMPIIDAYFRKFRDAGLRTGICFRPQKVEFNAAGYPVQKELSGEDAYQEMREDLEYAKKRWGCTLFYIDSTFDAKGPLDPKLFTRLHREFPDVLLMPENQTLLYYTCSAPLDSMSHHGVARTAPKIRELWPEAFTVTMANGGTQMNGENKLAPEVRAQRSEALVDGVKHGDILMIHGWYMHEGTREVMSIYKEAAATK